MEYSYTTTSDSGFRKSSLLSPPPAMEIEWNQIQN